jgi:hypothetical protein
MSFTIISHWKIFNEAMCAQVYVCLLIFSKGFLQRDIRDMSMLIVFLLIVPLDYMSFYSITRWHSPFFRWVLEGIYMTIGHLLSKGSVKNQLQWLLITMVNSEAQWALGPRWTMPSSLSLTAAVATVVLHHPKGSPTWNHRVVSFTLVYMYK